MKALVVPKFYLEMFKPFALNGLCIAASASQTRQVK